MKNEIRPPKGFLNSEVPSFPFLLSLALQKSCILATKNFLANLSLTTFATDY